MENYIFDGCSLHRHSDKQHRIASHLFWSVNREELIYIMGHINQPPARECLVDYGAENCMVTESMFY